MRGAVGRAFARPIAHRGLHRAGGPVENTLASAEAAVAAGYGIECDVLLSRDGRAMVCHDERLERLAGLAAGLADLDAAALQAVRLADGSGIPTLAALLALVAGRVPLVIELKATAGGHDERLADAVLAEVADAPGPVVLESFSAAIVARCAGARCPVGLVGPSRNGPATAAMPRRCDFLSWSVDSLAEATAFGLPLTTWTVRTPGQRRSAEAAGAQIVFEGFMP